MKSIKSVCKVKYKCNRIEKDGTTTPVTVDFNKCGVNAICKPGTSDTEENLCAIFTEDGYFIVDIPSHVALTLSSILLGSNSPYLSSNYYNSSEVNERRSGRTTRLIDRHIQDLFREQSVTCIDHITHPAANAGKLSKYICDRIIKRLKSEHRLTDDGIKVDKVGLFYKITLV